MKIIYLILTILIAIAGITFSILNAETVSVNFYFAQYQFPLSILIVITIAIGLLLGLCSSMISIVKLRSKNYRLNSKLSMLQKEVENLRAIPLKDQH